MIIGQVLHAINGADGTETYYFSPWFGRGGNLMGLVADIIATEGLKEFGVTVQTKNTEDADPGTGLTSEMVVNPVTAGTHNSVVGATLPGATAGALELVRYRFRLEVAGTTADGWIHFRMLNPTWLTN